MSILISVIMSVKNGEKYLNQSIESILNQSYKNFEFLICDDGSSDNSLSIINNYSLKDSRIKLITNKKSIGLTKSLNRLIKLSKGEVIARQDADDISAVNRFTTQINLYRKGKKIITARANIINSKKSKPRLSYFVPNKIIIKRKNCFVHGTLFINKQILIDNNCYDEEFYYSQDYKLFSDLLKKDYKINTIFKTLYSVRNEGNISSLKKDEQKYFADLVKQSQI